MSGANTSAPEVIAFSAGGRVWHPVFTDAVLDDLKRVLDISFGAAASMSNETYDYVGRELQELIDGDAQRFLHALYLACWRQCGWTPEQAFGARGDRFLRSACADYATYLAAWRAFVRALAVKFPTSPGVAAAVRGVEFQITGYTYEGG